MNELYHSGRLGQKWGVRNGPPYPLDRATVSSKYGKKKKLKAAKSDVDSNRKASASSKSSRRFGEGPENTQESTAEIKRRIIDSGDLKLIDANKKFLTNQELSQALDRVRLEKNLARELETIKPPTRMDRIDAFMTKVNKINGWVNTAKNAYDTYNRLTGKKTEDKTRTDYDKIMENISNFSDKDLEKIVKRRNLESSIAKAASETRNNQNEKPAENKSKSENKQKDSSDSNSQLSIDGMRWKKPDINDLYTRNKAAEKASGVSYEDMRRLLTKKDRKK